MIYQLGDHKPQIDPQAWIAPNAPCIGRVVVAAQASIWWNAVLRGDNDWIRVGAGSNVQDGAVLHTDPGLELVLGSDVTVGHQVTLHGCHVETGALIGMSATVLNGAQVGEQALVGAGALVPEGMQVPPGALVVGVPAKVVRIMSAQERAKTQAQAQSYRDKIQFYKQGLHLLDEEP